MNVIPTSKILPNFATYNSGFLKYSRTWEWRKPLFISTYGQPQTFFAREKVPTLFLKTAICFPFFSKFPTWYLKLDLSLPHKIPCLQFSSLDVTIFTRPIVLMPKMFWGLQQESVFLNWMVSLYVETILSYYHVLLF